MKRLLLAAVCVTILSGGNALASAKPDMLKDKPHHEMKMHEDLAKKLNLTDEQKDKAEKIREEGRKQMKPLMEEKKKLHEKMDALRKANMEEFEKILTDEQKQEFAKIKEQHKSSHHGKKKGKFGHKAKDDMKKHHEEKHEKKEAKDKK